MNPNKDIVVEKPKRKYTRKPKVEPVVEPVPEVKPKRKYVRRPKAIVTEEAPVETSPKKERKSNPWLEHVSAVKVKHADKTYKELLSIAKDSYKK